MTLLQLIKVKW